MTVKNDLTHKVQENINRDDIGMPTKIQKMGADVESIWGTRSEKAEC